MFYCLVDALPINTNQQPSKRFVKTFIIGCICHLVVYSFLSIDLLVNNPIIHVFVNLIRQWYWIIFMIDLSMLGILNKGFFGYETIKNLIFDKNKHVDMIDHPTQELFQLKQPDTQLLNESKQLHKKSPKYAKKIHEELDIDLLTENEEKMEKEEKTEDELIPKSINSSDTLKVDDSDIVCDTDEPDNDKIGENPKLTEDNINKYVTNKNKIVTDMSIKSEDLNLS